MAPLNMVDLYEPEVGEYFKQYNLNQEEPDMKRIFVLSVLVCMSLAMGGAAFAGHGSYTNG
ncbi:MAG: hypothetical protein FWG59_02330, partial [Betaproteobacteria bacterium]|nr:hypothetical protein [Betaproteobacteria bacterium]